MRAIRRLLTAGLAAGATAAWAMLLCAMAVPAAADQPARGEMGRSVKLRILVDKVMQPEADWHTEEWMVQEAADAGFNVWSPRLGHDDLAEVAQVSEWCRKHGIYHMPWMRGTLSAPEGEAAAGKRVVWGSGSEQTLWSPNSDEFWDWTTKYIVEYARMCAADSTLMGVFLDYENYAPGLKGGNLYDLSYDDLTLARFAAAEQLELPKLALDRRKAWLQEQSLHERFAAFQIDHWRQRCRALRQAVDRHDPAFQFCIYPAPGTPFMVEATYPEWATERAPLILADASVYGRPGRVIPQADALARNRQKLVDGMQVPRQRGTPHIYAGGIDPVVRGADPEFCGKNAVMISDTTDGYWIFYEGVKYDSPQQTQYWKWFTWANRAIAAGRFAAQDEPRETAESWNLPVFLRPIDKRRLTLPPGNGTAKYPPLKLRGDNLLALAGRADRAVALTLANIPFSRYAASMIWEVRDAAQRPIASGIIPHGQQGRVQFTPPADGVYLLGATADQCAYGVVQSNTPVGLLAREPLHLVQGVERLYFKVPAGATRFQLTARGSGTAETVRLVVFDPTGAVATDEQTGAERTTAEVLVPVGPHADAVWSLRLARADVGTLEDCYIQLGPQLPPVLSLSPNECFGLAPRN